MAAKNLLKHALANKPHYNQWVGDIDYLKNQMARTYTADDRSVVLVGLGKRGSNGETVLNTGAIRNPDETTRPVTIAELVRRLKAICRIIRKPLPPIPTSSPYSQKCSDGQSTFPQFQLLYRNFDLYCQNLVLQVLGWLSDESPAIGLGFLPGAVKRDFVHMMKEIGVEGEIVLEKYVAETNAYRKGAVAKAGPAIREIVREKVPREHLHHGMSVVHGLYGYISAVAATYIELIRFTEVGNTYLITIAEKSPAYTTPTSTSEPLVLRFTDLLMFEQWTLSPAAYIAWIYREKDGNGTGAPRVAAVPSTSNQIYRPYYYWDAGVADLEA